MALAGVLSGESNIRALAASVHASGIDASTKEKEAVFKDLQKQLSEMGSH
jgi:hypothetical protein